MKKTITFCLTLSLLSACGGRNANPVMASQYGDERKSCAALEVEINNTQAEIQRLIPQTDKTGKNIALGVAGAFLIVPWFFMDLSHAEQEEIVAYRNRYNTLVSLAADKHCGGNYQPLPEIKTTANPDKSPTAYPAKRQ